MSRLTAAERRVLDEFRRAPRKRPKARDPVADGLRDIFNARARILKETRRVCGVND